MLVKVGLHRRGPALYVRPAEFRSFEERGFGVGAGKHVSMVLHETHLDVMPSNVGPHFQAANDREAGLGWSFMARDDDSRTSPVRSCVHAAKAEWFGIRLVVDLLLPHLLPWPKERQNNDIDRDGIVMDLRARIHSSEKHTGSRRLAVPYNVINVLTDAEQERLFEEWKI